MKEGEIALSFDKEFFDSFTEHGKAKYVVYSFLQHNKQDGVVSVYFTNYKEANKYYLKNQATSPSRLSKIDKESPEYVKNEFYPLKIIKSTNDRHVNLISVSVIPVSP